ncbi:HAD family hydrolase [Marinicrinis lubricantis]|uniref:HAD family hydrolase n=1 Tax=Marinicrinis lubricantis TaxID=2086470 RepID=A0ABW1INL9_9BACL
MKQHLFFDLDDTLVHCTKYFNHTLEHFAVEMAEWFKEENISPEEIKEKQVELDLIGVQKHGFLKERFPQSLAETYQHFCSRTDRPILNEHVQHLMNLGMQVYEQNYEPYPNMEETLNELMRDGHRLYLYTGGVPEVQNIKIEQLELRRFFEDRIFIVQHKNLSALETILQQQRLDKQHVWMIGNSARTDILPALKAGLHAIHVKREEEWEYNVVDINHSPQGAYYETKAISEIPTLIRKYVLGTS